MITGALIILGILGGFAYRRLATATLRDNLLPATVAVSWSALFTVIAVFVSQGKQSGLTIYATTALITIVAETAFRWVIKES